MQFRQLKMLIDVFGPDTVNVYHASLRFRRFRSSNFILKDDLWRKRPIAENTNKMMEIIKFQRHANTAFIG